MDDSLLIDIESRGATVDFDNPWPGLLAYSEADHDFFHGRRRESQELVRLVQRGSLTVLFGLSGLGKTSLLQAGVFPELRNKRIFPIYIRLDFSKGHTPFTDQVKQTVAREAQNRGVEIPTAIDGETLWEYTHRVNADFWYHNQLWMPLFVFDQFEEIFTLGRTNPESEAFLVELGDLIEGRPPAHLKARFDADPEAADAFTLRRHHYKVLLSLREDYLADLETYRRAIPSLIHHRMRLLKMNGEAARQVVSHADHLIAPDVAEQVVRFVAKADTSTPLEKLVIDPSILSLFCLELNNKRKHEGAEQITRALLTGSQSAILKGFYERSIGDRPPEVRVFVEEELLTASGYRDSVAEDNASDLRDEDIDELVKRRLIRREARGGMTRLELTHDVLTPVISSSRERRREQEKEERKRKQEQLAEKEEATRKEVEAAKKFRKLTRIIGTLAIFLGLALAGVAWGFLNANTQKEIAENQRQIAELNADTARIQTQIADSLRQLAENNADTARVQRRIAELNANTARVQRRIAELNADSAKRNADFAFVQRQIAELNADSAERYADFALVQRRIAELNAETARVQRLQIMGLALAAETQRQLENNNPTDAAFLAIEAYYYDDLSGGQYKAEAFEALQQSLTNLNRNNTTSRTLTFNSAKIGNGVREVNYIGNSIVATENNGTLHISESDSTLLEKADRHILELLKEISAQHPIPGSIKFISTELIALVQRDSISIWSIEGGSIQERSVKYDTAKALKSIVLHPDWDFLIAGTDKGELWKIPFGGDKSTRLVFSMQESIHALAVNSSGTIITTGDANGIVRMWKFDSFDQEGEDLLGHKGAINALAFSSDGHRLASASRDHTIRVWDLDRLDVRPIELTGHTSWVNDVAFSPDNKALVSGAADKTVRLWQIDPIRLVQDLCDLLSTSSLTEELWYTYTRSKDKYPDSCKN